MRARFPAIVCALLCWGSSGAGAVDKTIETCFEKASNAEQRACMRELHQATSAELDQVLARKLARMAEPAPDSHRVPPFDPAARIVALQKAQAAWLAYREAECWGVVGSGGGSGSHTWAYVCLVEKTRERMRELTVPIEQDR